MALIVPLSLLLIAPRFTRSTAPHSLLLPFVIPKAHAQRLLSKRRLGQDLLVLTHLLVPLHCENLLSKCDSVGAFQVSGAHPNVLHKLRLIVELPFRLIVGSNSEISNLNVYPLHRTIGAMAVINQFAHTNLVKNLCAEDSLLGYSETALT